MSIEAARLYVTVGAQTREAEAGLRAIGEKVDSVGQSIKSGFAVGAGMKAFEVFLGGLNQSIGVLKATTIDYNNLLEQTRIAFTTMLAPVNNGFRDMEAGAKNAFLFMQQLRDFAAKTPFEFPELVVNAQRLQAMGFAAQEVIPMLTTIGNVSAAMGKGAEGIQRMTTALGQMNSSQKIMTQDLNQLIEVGVPVWQILSDAIGKPTGELRKMVEQGEIASDVFIKAFDEWAKSQFGDMMALQAKTFSGALSTVKDVLRDATADAAQPFFAAMTQGLVSLGEALQSDTFKVWAAATSAGLQNLLDAGNRFAQNFAGVGTAVGEAFAKLSAGDVQGAIGSLATSMQAGLDNVMQVISGFGEGMFGAGWNVITTFGNGMVEALNGAIEMVSSGLAGLAALLVGQSPPPEGPLSTVDQGGKAIGAAWVQGVDSELEKGKGVAKKAADAMASGLRAAAEGIEDSIRAIDSSMRELEAGSQRLRMQIDDIKQASQDRLEPLEEQVRAIKDRGDYAAEELALAEQLEAAELARAEAVARGDGELRARIKSQIDELDAQKGLLELENRRVEIQRKMAGPTAAAQALETLREQDQTSRRGGRSQAERRLEELRDQRSRGDDGPSRLERQLEEMRRRRPERRERAERGPSRAEQMLEELQARRPERYQRQQGPAGYERRERPISDAERRLEELRNAPRDQFVARNTERIRQLRESRGGGGASDELDDQRKALGFQQRRLALADREAELRRKAGPQDVSAETEELRLDRMQQQLRTQQRSAALDERRAKLAERAAAGEDVSAELAEVERDTRELAISNQQEMNDLAEREAAIRKKGAGEDVSAELQRLELEKQALELDIKAEEQRKKDREEQRAIDEQIRALEAQDRAEQAAFQAAQAAREAEQRALEIQARQEREAWEAQEKQREDAARQAADAWNAQEDAREEQARAAEAEWQAQVDQLAKQVAAEKKANQAADRAAAEAARREDEQYQKNVESLEDRVRAEKEKERATERRHQSEVQTAEKAVKAERDADAAQREQRQAKIADLERTVRGEQKAAATERAQRENEILALDLRRTELQQQEAGTVDRSALARITAAKNELAERRSMHELAQREEELRKRIAALPIEKQIADIKRETEATVNPLERQLRETQRRTQELSNQKQELQAQRQLLQDQISDIKAAATEAEKARKAAKGDSAGPSVTLKPGETRLPQQALDPSLAGKADEMRKRGQELAEKLAEGFGDAIRARFGQLAGGAIGAVLGGIALGPIGALMGAGLGAAIGGKLQEKLAEMGIDTGDFAEAIKRLGTTIQEALVPVIQTVLPPLTEAITFLADHKEIVVGVAAAFGAFAVLSTIVPAAIAFGTAVGGIISAIGGAIGILSSIVGILTSTGSVTVALGAAFTSAAGPVTALVALLGGPVTLTIAAVAAAIGLLTAAWVGNWGDIQGKTRAVVEYVSSLPATLSGYWDRITETAQALSDAVSGAWQGMKDGISSAIDWIESRPAAAWQAVQDTIAGIQDSIKQKILDVWNAIPADVRADLELIANHISERSAFWYDVISEALQKTWDDVKAKWEGIKKAIGDTLKGIGDAIEKAWASLVKGTNDNFLEPVRRAVTDMWGRISRATSDVWRGIGEFFDTWFAGTVRAFGTFVGEWWTKFSEWGEKLVADAKQYANDAWQGFTDAVTGWKDRAVNAFWDLVRAALAKIKEFLGISSPSTVMAEVGSSMIQGLLDGAKALWDAPQGFLRWLSSSVSGMLGKVRELLGIGGEGGVSAVFTGIGKGISEGLKAGASAAWDAASGVMAWAREKAQGLADHFKTTWGIDAGSASVFYTFGSKILERLRDGMQSFAGQIEAWVRQNIIDKIPDKIKEFLGINSPSTVMYDIGVNIMQGLIGGMQSKLGQLGGVSALIRKFMPGGVSGAADPSAASGEIADYIRQAAMMRGIDPNVALTVAANEGGWEEPARQGRFPTGYSWWPFQLHYAMAGQPGVTDPTTGMGDDFTRQTGFAPGDPRAWKASIDFALDHAQRYGWGAWYGARKVGITGFDGIARGYDRGGILPADVRGYDVQSRQPVVAHKGEGIFNREQMASLAPLSAVAGALSGAQSGRSGGDTHLHFYGPVYGFPDFEDAVLNATRMIAKRQRNFELGGPQ